jgi:hypothetical protein
MISERFRQFRAATWPLARPALGLRTMRIGLCLSLWLCARAMGAEYWVAPDGDDSGPGTSDQPWRTIQQGANRAQPGDTIFVRSGHYPERVTTARGGTGSNARIVFRAVGLVEMRGWIIRHPYITIDGFGITGHTASTTSDAYIWIRNGGDHSEVLNCRVHDGIEIVDDSVEFRSASNAVVVPRGGLLAAGFAPGTFVVFFPQPGL